MGGSAQPAPCFWKTIINLKSIAGRQLGDGYTGAAQFPSMLSFLQKVKNNLLCVIRGKLVQKLQRNLPLFKIHLLLIFHNLVIFIFFHNLVGQKLPRKLLPNYHWLSCKGKWKIFDFYLTRSYKWGNYWGTKRNLYACSKQRDDIK